MMSWPCPETTVSAAGGGAGVPTLTVKACESGPAPTLIVKVPTSAGVLPAVKMACA